MINRYMCSIFAVLAIDIIDLMVQPMAMWVLEERSRTQR